MFKRLFLAAFFILLPGIFNGSWAGQHTYIKIRNPLLNKTPIAVTRFRLTSKSVQERRDALAAEQMLKDALAFTGYLKPMNPAAFLADPSQTGVSKAEINFRNWTDIGAELLVTAKINEESNRRVSFELRLFDTFKSTLLVGNVYSGTRTQIRQIIHTFCSEISFALTGNYGVFNSKIAFVSRSGGVKEIFTCDFDGRNIRQFTTHKNICLSPSWSPDGQRLAYVSFARGGTKILVKQVKGRMGSVFNYRGTALSPDWMPGSMQLVASLSHQKDPEIYLLTRDGEMIKRITYSLGIDVSPKVSPDGRTIAFTSKRYGTPQICTKNLETGQVRRVTFDGFHNTSPAWSPDGRRLAYVGIEDNQINIFVIDVASGLPVQLTRDSGDNEDPCWSPDGSMLVFTSTREGGVQRLYVMNATGTDQRRLLKMKGRQSQPDWSLPLKTDN